LHSSARELHRSYRAGTRERSRGRHRVKISPDLTPRNMC
jgi:hypothetical protein